MLATYDEFAFRPEPRPGFAERDTPTRAAMHRAWSDSTEAEKRALTDIATGGIANPHERNRPVVGSLVSRGLLDRDTLSIPNAEFTEFVCESVTDSQVRRWREQDGTTTWAALRLPLATGTVLLLFAVSRSFPDLAALGAAVSALTAGVPSMVSLLEKLSR